MDPIPAPPLDGMTQHDDRPIGIAIGREQLRLGDLCTVTVEAQMQGLPTGTFLTFKRLIYRGIEHDRRRFDSEIEQHFFGDVEIVRVALCEE